MILLIDAQRPPALCGWLGDGGHAATHITEVMEGGATDRAVADLAERGATVLLSKETDFLCLRLPDRFALVWLRCGNATNRALFAWLAPRWPEIEQLLASGERLIEAR